MTMSPACRLSSALQGGFFSEYSIEDLECEDRVRLCKTNSTYHRREYNINGKPDIACYNRYSGFLEKNPPCNAEDNLCAGLIVIEAWFGGY